LAQKCVSVDIWLAQLDAKPIPDGIVESAIKSLQCQKVTADPDLNERRSILGDHIA
jgi:hypothetical protein